MNKEHEIHIGNNVKTLRELVGMKQDILADALGISPSKMSRLENQSWIDDETLVKIAEGLSKNEINMTITVETIKQFEKENAVKIYSNTFQDEAICAVRYQCTVNPLDKVEDLYERLCNEQKEHYERMLLEQKTHYDLELKLYSQLIDEYKRLIGK